MIGKEILNYTITSFVGKGGMGSVYVAENKHIRQQKVAIKVINADMVNDFTRQRLQEEAEHLASLDHPNIVHFLNYHVDDAGNVYLIMEYADGVSLDQYIQTISGLIVEDRICPLFEPILDAVGYAHKHHIVHRDIKPSNIIITQEGSPKILDFGIAKIIKQEDEDSDRLIMGTPSYMSPEQVKGEHLDERSDIYSLGVLLHQMLTGNAPYDTTTLTEFDINRKVVEEPLPRMKTYYKYVSDKVQRIVDKATAKRPADRYQTCEEFKKALHTAIYPPKVPLWTKLSAAAVLLLIAGLGVWWWDYTRTKVYYYKDYVEQWGIPVGIHELSSDEVAHRTGSYRLEVCRRKPVGLAYVNSKGSIIPHSTTDDINRPAESRYYYNEDGSLDYIHILDQCGKVLMVKDYVGKDLKVAIFRYNDEYGTEKNLSAKTITTFTSSIGDDDKRGKVSRYLITYDEHGFVAEIKYAGFQNVRVADADGIFGLRYEVDGLGRVTQETFVDYDGNPKATASGMAIRTREYNSADDAVRFTYLSPTREPAGEEGLKIPVCHNEVDRWGNVICQTYEDMDGHLMLRADCGIAGSEHEIEDGVQVRQTYIGLDGKPAISSGEGQGFAGALCRYDPHGFPTEQLWIDTDGNPCADMQGCYGMNMGCDEHGNFLKIVYLDADGSPYTLKEGYASVQNTFDPLGNLISQTYCDEEGNPVNSTDGYAAIKWVYDEQNRPILKTYCDEDGDIISGDDGLIPVVKTKYTLQGNRELVEFFNASQDSLFVSSEGIAGWKSTFDDFSNETSREVFAPDRSKTSLAGEAYAGWRATYDDHGNQQTKTYYDLSGNPCNTSEGYATVINEYDERGNLTSVRKTDAQGRLPKGLANERRKYDAQDNLVEMTYYDDAGRPTTDSDGAWRITYAYDDKRNRIEMCQYDTDNRLMLAGSEKIAIWRWKYDERGNSVEVSTYGTDGKPAIRKDATRYAIMRSEYDAMGRVVRQTFYDTDGKPTSPNQFVPEVLYGYDEYGNRNYIASADGHGNLIFNPQYGYAVNRMVYNRYSHIVEDRYYDQDDHPMNLGDNNWSIKRWEYDKRNNCTSEAYFDVDDKPVVSKSNGYHKAACTYDARDQMLSKAYFNANGNPMTVNGIHRTVYTHDALGRLATEEIYDVGGKPTTGNYGFSKAVYAYKGDSRTASTCKVYNTAGKLVNSYHRDANGNWAVDEVLTPWQDQVRALSSELPYDLGEDANNLVLKSIRAVSASSAEIVFVAPRSRYDMSEEDISFYQKMSEIYAQVFRENLNMPRSVRLTVILMDSKNRVMKQFSK